MAAECNELEIDNFSFWNNDIHGDSLDLKFKIHYAPITLYPRGVGGEGQQLEVRIISCLFPRDGELSFIGSDGLIRKKTPCDYRNKFKYFTGPLFEEVVAGISENEPLHKDRLILRWNPPFEGPIRKRTVIEVSSALFQIKPEMFDYSNDWKQISNITFPTVDEKERHLSVSVRKPDSETEVSKVEFKLESNNEKSFLAVTSIWMLNDNRIIQIYRHDCVLNKERYEILPFEVLLKDIQELKAIMRFKIATGRVYQEGDIGFLQLSPHIRVTNASQSSEAKSLLCQSTVDSDTTRVLNSSPIPLDARRKFSESSELKETPSENAVTVLAKDLMCLYQDNHLSDLELRCETVTFPTHKNILSARSPVFKAMLSGDMKEATCGHVDVEDLDPHTLGRFLSFLYSGATGEEDLTWDEASKLYYAADKYQVPSLKKECAAVLHNNVKLENVCDILSLADKHQDEELRSVAHEFVVENYNELLRSESWDKFVSSDPILVAKTLTNFAKNNSVKKSDSK